MYKKELDDGYIQQIKDTDGSYVLKFNNLPLSSPLKYFKTSGDFSKGTGVINGLSESEAAKSEPNIIIPDGTVEIGASAFYDNKSIEKLVISDTVTKIGTSIFQQNTQYETSKLSFLKLGRSLKEISEFAFVHNFNLTSVEWYSGLEKISTYAFANVPLTKDVVLPKSVQILESGAFKVFPEQQNDEKFKVKIFTTWATTMNADFAVNGIWGFRGLKRLNLIVNDASYFKANNEIFGRLTDDCIFYIPNGGMKDKIKELNPGIDEKRLVVEPNLITQFN